MKTRTSNRKNNKKYHTSHKNVFRKKLSQTKRKIIRKRFAHKKSFFLNPWMTNNSIISTGIAKLHYEIRDYVDYITPSKEDVIKRKEIILLIESLIKSRDDDWSIKVFGSFSQGLSTIHSDLDIVIINNNVKSNDSDLNMLLQIKEIIKKANQFKKTVVIFAKVPIIKTTHKATMIKIDISVNKKNGIEAAEIIKGIITIEPILKYSIIFIKEILRRSNLNNASFGGMSSFLLFSIVFFYYQRCINKDRLDFDTESTSSDWIIIDSYEDNILDNLGTFLIGFFKYYSTELKERKYAICLNTGGIEIAKNLKVNCTIHNNLLYVENFQEEHNDIGKLCFLYHKIKSLFKKCLLSLYKSKGNTYSYLKDLGL